MILEDILTSEEATGAGAAMLPVISSTRDRPQAWLDGILFALASLALFLLSTRHGIGILPDTTRYMGLIEAPYDAPLYAWVLAAGTSVGLSIEYAAKVIGLLLACANSFLVWLLLIRTTGKRAYAAVGTALIVFSPLYVSMHSVAMSEPLFLFCILLTLFAVLEYWKAEQRVWLICCGAAVGAAALVRFTAPPLGAAIALCLLLDPRPRLSRRISDAAILAVVSGGIFFGWVLFSQSTAGRSLGRELTFHGNMDAEAWMSSLHSLTALFLPTQVPLLLRVAVSAYLLCGAAYLCWRQRRNVLSHPDGKGRLGDMLPTVLGLFFVFYVAFLLLAFWVEANQHFVGRYLFPVYVTTVIMATVALAGVPGGSGRARWFRALFLLLAVLVLASHLVRTADRTREAYVEGIGYAGVKWQQSPIVQAARGLPADATIYSNGADALSFVLKRPVLQSPAHTDPRTEREPRHTPLAQQFDELRDELAAGNTYVVFVDAVDWRDYLVPEDDLRQRLDMQLVDQEPDGRIYARKQPSSQPTQ